MSVRIEDHDHGWEAMQRLLAEIGEMEVVVGIHADEASEIKVRAAANEYGTARIPERSFLRSTFDEQAGKLREAANRTINLILSGKYPVDTGLGRFGQFAESLVRSKVESNIPPPNAPATVKAKARQYKGKKRQAVIAGNKTLIDTGAMLQAIRYSVRRRGTT